MKRYGEVPRVNLVRYPKEELLIAKSGNDVRMFLVIDGVCYQASLYPTSEVGDNATANDHGLLSGLSDDDHTQYVLRSILTTKGDILGYTGTAVARQSVGDNNKPLVADSTGANGLRYGGNVLVGDAEIDGAINHDGSTVGFFGVTPASRASALTQTYSTADRTLSAYTADDESAAYTGIDNAQAGTVYAAVADLNALRAAYETLRALTEDLAAFVNSVVDDLQTYGLEQ